METETLIMKKYLRLTTREAISHFIDRDGVLTPETSAEIRQKLADLADLKSDVSVTIVIPTHRVRPDANKDIIVLKNRVDAAEGYLLFMMNKRAVWPIAENLREAEEVIQSFTNQLDSLVVYANEHFSSVVKLPIDLPEQTTIGKYFDLRPLYKTMQQNRRYYVLTVSRNKIRLIEAFNDKVVTEIETGDFPFEKTSLYTIPRDVPTGDGFEETKEMEFYNDADKSFKKVYNENPMSVVIAGDVKSVAYYEREMDDSSMVIGRAAGSFDNMPLHEIMTLVAPEVAKYREKTVKEYLTAIDAARSAKLLTTDIRQMIEKSRNGQADTLYIGNNFSMRTDPANLDMTAEELAEQTRKTDDLFFGLLMDVTRNGGTIVFMEDELLAQYGGIVMARRF